MLLSPALAAGLHTRTPPLTCFIDSDNDNNNHDNNSNNDNHNNNNDNNHDNNNNNSTDSDNDNHNDSNGNSQNACQPGLGAYGASLSSPGFDDGWED